jgi:hypothetical protein
MKKLLIIGLTMLLIQNCRISQQTKQIKALEKCVYEILSADSLYIAGTDVKSVIKNKNIDMKRLPGIALALLRKDIPLEARLNLQIKNPSPDMAAINQFDYIVLIKNEEIANGSVNQKISLATGESTTVPVMLNANIYRFFSNPKIMQQITDFIQAGSDGGPEKKGLITLKIKPSIQVGNRIIKYPGYITIDKEVSSKILF